MSTRDEMEDDALHWLNQADEVATRAVRAVTDPFTDITPPEVVALAQTSQACTALAMAELKRIEILGRGI